MGDRSAEVVTYLPASLLRAVAALDEHRGRGGVNLALDVPFCHEVDGTLVMADLSGFTALSERLAKLGDEGAERLTDTINSFFEQMLKTASGYGGDTLTFGGDAVLLLFEGQDHASRAVAASLAMLKQVERAAAVDTGGGKVKIGMSVGAHSAAFLLGAAGLPEERVHLFVLGRGAETTALAEGKADRGQLCISTAAKRLLSGRVKTTSAGDFRRVLEFAGGGSPLVASGRASASRVSPVSERVPFVEYPQVSEDQLRWLTPFLPPYARPGADAKGGRFQHPPEHRRTVIVFVNILGLNDVIASAGIDTALEQLQVYAATLTRLAAKHNGFVISTDIATQGSTFVVTFGAPVAHEYAPANAARFALDLTAALRESALDLQHKIGLNGGHVFAGEVGPPFRRQYTVMGDAVNLAARLMSAAKPGEALISRTLLDYVGPDLCARALEPIKVKGKERPVGVCVLEEERRSVGQIRGGAALEHEHGRLFGRRAELELIQREWEAARGGSGGVLLVEGDAGVGKTRLLEEALRGMTDAGRVTRAACFEHLQAAPFTPWVAVLEAVLEIPRGDPILHRTEAVKTFLEGRLADLVEFGSLLNSLLNVSLPQSDVVGSLDAQARRQKLFELIGRILTEAGRDRGHVVLVEDLHWMDDSSLALAAHLTQSTAGDATLFLLTTRPAETPADLGGPRVTRIVLVELSESESLAMVREALAVEDLPAELGEALFAKTKGNPLFLEEVIHSLQAPGVLERILGASSVTRAAQLAALEIPDRVQGLLMSRIDRLAPDTREVLKAGSVVGRSFDEKVLGGIDDPLLRPVSLRRAFDELAASALVVPGDEADGPSVTFRHALVQDVAYESLPFVRRRDLHGRVARYLESVQETPDHALLVHHFQRAGDGEKTRLHAVRVSESSVAVYANLEAIDYLGIAHDTVHGRAPRDACLRSRLEELKGDSLATLARHDEAIGCFGQARRRWASPGVRQVSQAALRDLTPLEEADARDSLLCWKIAVSLERGPAAYKRALRWLERATAALPPQHDSLRARMLVTRCAVLSRLGRYRQAVAFGEEGVALARDDGNPALQAYALTLLANSFAGLGLLDRAMDCDSESVVLYEQAGDLSGQALSHMNVASSYFLLGDLRAALEHEELSLALYSRIGNMSGVAIQHHNVAGVLLQMGEIDAAIEHLEAALRLRFHPGVGPHVAGFALLLLCKARVWSDDLDAAERALTECLDILEGIDAQDDLLFARVIEGELRLAQGDLESAESVCRRVLSEARSMEAELNEAQALCMLGRVQFAKGEADVAIAGLEACVALAERIGAEYERAQALAALAEAQACCGDADEACEGPLCEAIGLFEKQGAGCDLRQALATRERLRPARSGGRQRPV